MKTGHLEMAIDLYSKKVYEDIKRGKADYKAVEALERLVGSWATMLSIAKAKEVADNIRRLTGRSPELPFEFPRARKPEAI